MTGDFMAQDTVWDKHTWIFKMPATWVVEGVIVNFHSDLQRPFLKKTSKTEIGCHPTGYEKKKIPTYKVVKGNQRMKFAVQLHMQKIFP